MSTSTLSRSQGEIVARLEQVKPADMLGFKAEVLVVVLDFEHARPFLKPGVTAEQWEAPPDRAALETQAREYLEFAVGKAIDHRGISANRSVDKLEEWAWLLGRDDVIAAMRAAGYTNYGAPKLVAFAEGMGWTDALPTRDAPEPSGDGPERWDYERDQGFWRMAQGEPCRDDCDEGCGR